MPAVKEEVPMAECVNYGLASNEDLRQTIMPTGPLLADMLLRGMHKDLKCIEMNSLPSQNEDDDSVILSLSSRNHEDLDPPNQLNDSSNAGGEPYSEKHMDNNSDDSERAIDLTDQCSSNYLEVPSNESSIYFLPVNHNKRNPWRRIIGLHASGNELRSATYPARSSVKKLRFAQAKKPLNCLYSYFSVQILDCDDKSSIIIGVCRKDYPSKVGLGKTAGSVGYCSDTGRVFIRDSPIIDGPQFSKGDVIGCGIVYPSHYKRYADLSTDDNSDGMTDVVLTSLLNINKKSMHFVCDVLNINAQDSDTSSDNESYCNEGKVDECDFYNENFVESRTQVEVYFTHNMQIIGKVSLHIPVGGLYPTVHIFSCSAIRMNVDLNPPSS